MTAKENLSQINKLETLYVNTMAEAQRWWEIATNMSPNMSGERVQSSGSTDTTANALCTYMELEREAEQYKQQREEILNNIKRLSAVHYDVLYRHYVLEIPLKTIAVKYKRRPEWASRTHTAALKAYEKILKGSDKK